MPNKLQCEQPQENNLEHDKREMINNRIREQVIHALGTPADLHDVQVRRVWADHYRVNVFVGVNSGSVRVANSFFVVIGSDGDLITATPKITKQY
jgi:hypothetical protein